MYAFFNKNKNLAIQHNHWDWEIFSSKKCQTQDYNRDECIRSNYLYKGSYEWTMAPRSGSSEDALRVNSSGVVRNDGVAMGKDEVRVVAFLKSRIQYISGDGSENYPYVIGSVN